MKKIICFVLSIAFLAGFIPLSPAMAGGQASAASDEKAIDAAVKAEVKSTGIYGGMEYSISEGEVTITGYTDDLPSNVTVPNTIEGLPVTAIGYRAFYYCNALTTIEMPAVKAIGEGAFYSCFALTTIKMPAVTTIGNFAFYCCNALTTIEMLAVTSIGNEAFGGCSVLSAINIPVVTTIGDYAFSYCDALTIINIPTCTISIGVNPFIDCSSLTTINVAVDNMNYISDGGILYNRDKTLLIASIPTPGAVVTAATVTTIGDAAFFNCYGLITIEMPAVTSISRGAFYDCDALTTIKMPVVTAIDNYAFYNCYRLTTINMSTVTTIGYEAFSWCEALTSAYFYSDAPEKFEDYVFNYCADNFTIYYAAGTAGWTTPTWNGYPTQEFTPENHHKVTFIDGVTNEVIVNRIVADGSDVTFPNPPTHEGYTFKNWDKDGKNITADTTITAIYEKDQPTLLDDINGDNKITTIDALLILRSLAGWDIDIVTEVGDINNDTKITTIDALLILRHLAGWDIPQLG